MIDVMHTRVGYGLWWFLYRIDCIRRFVPTPPEREDGRSPAGYMTPGMLAWKRDCSKWNARIDPRTPGQREAETQSLLTRAASRRAELTALGYCLSR